MTDTIQAFAMQTLLSPSHIASGIIPMPLIFFLDYYFGVVCIREQLLITRLFVYEH